MQLNGFLRIAALAALGLATGPYGTARADGLLGAYLAGRHAAAENDFSEGARYFSRALILDPNNKGLLEDAVTSYVALGQFDRAAPLARQMIELDVESQIGGIAMVENLTEVGDFEPMLTLMEARAIRIAPLVDTLVKGWAQIGAGQMTDGLKTFEGLNDNPASRAYGLYHSALALILAGDLEGADAILDGDRGGNDRLTLNRRGILAYAELLSQLGRNPDAITLIDNAFGSTPDPGMEALRARLVAGEMLPLTVIRSARDGMAEVFHTLAAALDGETPDAFALGFSRVAEALRPDHVDSILLSAALLERMERYDLATETFKRIAPDSPYFYAAELGRAGALESSGREEAAIEVLQALARSHGDVPGVHVALGNILRREEKYEPAAEAYSKAIDLFGTPAPDQWNVYFIRGIARERAKRWPEAEADLRKALDLNPGQPQVLNYLGYSLVELNQNLDEALGMIEQAVTARPDDGYITDSLGWVLYRLGRYQEAVGHMERAVVLEPIDPVVNDHLGDVYWAVGRRREAEFQWQRALSFDPVEPDLSRIRRKLEVGLDQVLKDEGADPLAVAKDG